MKFMNGPSRNLFITGDLGSGKTTLLKGVGSALGLEEDEVVSPTFQLVRKYETSGESLFHLDLYRLSDIEEILYLGWIDMVEDKSFMAVEWADRAFEIWPEEGLFIKAQTLLEDERRYTIWTRKENVSLN